MGGRVSNADVVPIATIAAASDRSRCGTAASTIRTNDIRSAWKLSCHWSGPFSPPADTLETTMSSPDSCSAAASTKPATACSSDTSTAWV